MDVSDALQADAVDVLAEALNVGLVLLRLVLLDALRESHTASENEHDVARELILILSHPIFQVLFMLYCLGEKMSLKSSVLTALSAGESHLILPTIMPLSRPKLVSRATCMVKSFFPLNSLDTKC